MHVQNTEIRICFAATLKPETLTFKPYTCTALGGRRYSNPSVAPCRRQPSPSPLWSRSAFSSLSISRSLDRLVVERRHGATPGEDDHLHRPLLSLLLPLSLSLSGGCWGGVDGEPEQYPPSARGVCPKERGPLPLCSLFFVSFMPNCYNNPIANVSSISLSSG